MESAVPLRVAHPPPRPLMIFDGDCGFCRRWVGRFESITGEAVQYEPSQLVGKEYPEIGQAALDRAVHLVEPDGTVRRGGAAALRALALVGRERWAWWMYRHVAIFAAIVEWVYGVVSAHRGGWVDAADRWLLGRQPVWPSWRVGRWAFLRGIGVIYLIAFADGGWQIAGLIGSRGIFPIGELLKGYSPQWHVFPTLCWLNSSDAFLHAMCLSGCIAALLLIFNILPLGASMVAWVLYLSLATAGRMFFALQWDALLLEAGFLAILYAPFEPWPRLSPAGNGGEPPWVTRWLLRWLLFRLMFLSGLVKITSGDGTWTTFTALNYHYWTQPLPPWTAWYIAKAPEWFERLSVLFVLVTELICPVMILGPRRLRRIGLLGIALLQGLILLTGNYGFFNLLTLVLCLPLLENDSAFWRWIPMGKKLVARATAPVPTRKKPTDAFSIAWPTLVLAPVALCLIFLTTMAAVRDVDPHANLPAGMRAVADYFAPYEIANSYGLFRNMTRDRPEIILSGSDDGMHWRGYAFKWKPGDISHRPRFCTPIMPRLDWWMWFSALDAENAGPGGWDGSLLESTLLRLMQNSPSVVALLGENPFPDRPPRFVRAELYQYRFTTAAERRATGAWWHRELAGLIIEQANPEQP